MKEIIQQIHDHYDDPEMVSKLLSDLTMKIEDIEFDMNSLKQTCGVLIRERAANLSALKQALRLIEKQEYHELYAVLVPLAYPTTEENLE